jgi:UDP-N-acetylmuramoylalanine--D-glutamate ligase
MILNISPDHLDRHRTVSKYVNAKFKLVKNQSKKDLTILNVGNFYIKRQLKLKSFHPKIIRINKQTNINFINKVKNKYFTTDGNKENLQFIFAIMKILKLRKHFLFKTLEKFKGLNYRQEIVYNSKKLTIINDTKATSLSSSKSLLGSLNNIYWIVGGLAKKGDKLSLEKKNNQIIRAYIFGEDKVFFINKLKKLMRYEYFLNLKMLVKKIFLDINAEKKILHKTILFSPAAASFDNFKNFEERGKYFNKLISKHLNAKL